MRWVTSFPERIFLCPASPPQCALLFHEKKPLLFHPSLQVAEIQRMTGRDRMAPDIAVGCPGLNREVHVAPPCRAGPVSNPL
jgi:hypothetical protein